MDRLDAKTSPELNATQAQPKAEREVVNNFSHREVVEIIDEDGAPWVTRTPDLLIRSHIFPAADKENKGLSPADSGQVKVNPQPPRNQSFCLQTQPEEKIVTAFIARGTPVLVCPLAGRQHKKNLCTQMPTYQELKS